MKGSDGTTVSTYRYDVFGELRSPPTGMPKDTMLFTGEQYDAKARQIQSGVPGLYYLRARYYDPSIGRFLSQDPLPLLNRYTYVRNNPANFIDPYGLVDLTPDFVDEAVDELSGAVESAAEVADEIVEEVVEPVVNSASSAVGSALEFLSTCEGKLLAGGLVMVAFGGAMIAGGFLAMGALLHPPLGPHSRQRYTGCT